MSPKARRRRWTRGLQPADIGFVLLLAVALLYLIHEGRGNRFFYDEWSWIEFRRNGLSAILSSYNQHMEIVPLAVYQLMLHTVGLSHYHWFRLLAALGHLSLVTAVYCFARRRIGWLALIVVVPLAFFGAGWEFILWGVNFGFTTSIALAILAYLWLESDRRSAVGGCLLLVGSLMFSETAVLFSIGLAVELTWRDRSLRRAWVWAVPILIYIAWYIGFYESYLAEHNIGAIPTFGAQLAAGASAGMFGASGAVGWVVLALIALLLVVRLLRAGALSPRLIAVLLVVLGYWTLVAVGRSSLGDPTASRYVYSGAVLLLLVILESLRGIRIDWRSGVIFAVIALLALIGNLDAFGPGEASLFEGSNSEAAELTAVQLMKGFIAPNLVIDPHWSPVITPARYFAAVKNLHSTDADTLAQLLVLPEEERAAADLVLVRGGDLAIRQAAALGPVGGSAPTVELKLGGHLSSVHGCVRFAPSGSGSTLDLTVPADGLTIQVHANAGSASHPPTAIRVRRFASSYDNNPVASTQRSVTIRLIPHTDAASQAWHVRVSPWEPITACTVAG